MRHGRDCEGFTMVELLVVVTIIGILTAVAVPQFKEYRARAYDAAAQSDLRNAVTAQEAYFLDEQRYAADTSVLPGFVGSPDVRFEISSADDLDWAGKTSHLRGRQTFCFSTQETTGLRAVPGIEAPC